MLLQTGCDAKIDSKEYFEQPGMGRESTLWLVQEKGIRVIGIDAFGFDRPFAAMREDYERTGDGRFIWPAHFAGIEAPYCQIEKLANLGDAPGGPWLQGRLFSDQGQARECGVLARGGIRRAVSRSRRMGDARRSAQWNAYDGSR